MSKRDILKFEGCAEAWRRALAEGGLTLDDLSLVETHDCFTIAELIEYEAMGLTPEGQGARAVKASPIRRIAATLVLNGFQSSPCAIAAQIASTSSISIDNGLTGA